MATWTECQAADRKPGWNPLLTRDCSDEARAFRAIGDARGETTSIALRRFVLAELDGAAVADPGNGTTREETDR
jgi:hypothetical protein